MPRASRATRTLSALVAALVAGGLMLGTPSGAPAAPAPSAASAPDAGADAGPGTGSATGPDTGRQARILALQPTDGGGVRVVSDVTLPVADAPALPTDVPGATGSQVVLGTADGSVLRRSVPVTGTIRAELPREVGGTRLTGEEVVDPAPVLRVRVPVDADLRSVAVRVAGERHAAPYRPVVARATTPTLVELPGRTLGPSGNRLDVVVLGDGYTADQQQDFARDATAVVDEVLGTTPFAEHRDLLNVVGVFAPSAQSGADQPAYAGTCDGADAGTSCCPDPDASGLPARSVDTRYDSAFCTAGIQRLLVPGDMGAVFSDASAAFPAWEQVLLVVNDQTYGGSGGAIATASMDPSGTQVMAHELGHSLLGLDDEYSDHADYPPCSDLAGSGFAPCPANTTDVTTRAALKWRRWVDDATPIPTGGEPGPEVVGLFRGAHYSPDRWYRSCHSCLMRVLGAPMGPVGSEQLPLRLFGEVFGLSLVEPGSVSPPTDRTVVVAPGERVTLALDVLSTGSTPGTLVQWYVGGQPVRTDTVGTGTVSLEVTGAEVAQQVGVSVEALPGILHRSRARLVTYQDRVWTVAPTADGTLPGHATGAAVGPGRKYVRLGADIGCDPDDLAPGALDLRVVSPRGAARVSSIVLSADGEPFARIHGRRVPGSFVLFPGLGTEVVSAVVDRRGARTLRVERSYAPCQG